MKLETGCTNLVVFLVRRVHERGKWQHKQSLTSPPSFLKEKKLLRSFLEQRQRHALVDTASIGVNPVLHLCGCLCVFTPEGICFFDFLCSPSFSNILFLLLFSLSVFQGGDISTYPGHCGVSAGNHQPDSHHDGTRACPYCKYTQFCSTRVLERHRL